MKINRPKRLYVILISIALLVILLFAGAFFWYKQQLTAVNKDDQTVKIIQIKQGMTIADILDDLQKENLIRSAFAASIHLRLRQEPPKIQAGQHKISPALSLDEILQKISKAEIISQNITFYPGATIKSPKNDANSKMSAVSVLKKHGFSDQQIDEALNFPYQSDVFADRPKEAGLEGYIFGETYSISPDATATDVIKQVLGHFDKVVKDNDFVNKFAKHNLNLFEGITLASIVQRESIGCAGKDICEDQRQIAAVFYNRLQADMPLGSDVTYHYAADQANQPRDHTLDSPYNTRIHKGLTPTPIASAGLSALNAVADPAENDYLFFLSGDDDKTYFAKTIAEHENNIRQHCQEKCQLP